MESVQGADSGWKCCCTRHTSSKYCSAAASFTSYYFETCLLISFFAITVVKFLSIQSEATPNGALLLLLLRFIHLLLFFAVWTHSSSFFAESDFQSNANDAAASFSMDYFTSFALSDCTYFLFLIQPPFIQINRSSKCCSDN